MGVEGGDSRSPGRPNISIFRAVFVPRPIPGTPKFTKNTKIPTKIGEIIFAGIAGLAYVGNLDMYPVSKF